MISQSTIDLLLKEQRGLCVNCGRDLYQGYHAHHAVYTRDSRFARWLNMPENLVLLCPRCHANHGRLSNLQARQKFYQYKVERGYDMAGWHDGIPMLVKDKLEGN